MDYRHAIQWVKSRQAFLKIVEIRIFWQIERAEMSIWMKNYEKSKVLKNVLGLGLFRLGSLYLSFWKCCNTILNYIYCIIIEKFMNEFVPCFENVGDLTLWKFRNFSATQILLTHF